MSSHIPMDRWGKDHWSLLAYIETVCVDRHGMIDIQRMRCDVDRHPQYKLATGIPLSDKKYPTLLKEGRLPDHDDWDCLDDLEAAGLVESVGLTMQPRYTMTERGHRIAGMLRTYKANGGVYNEFTPPTGE